MTKHHWVLTDVGDDEGHDEGEAAQEPTTQCSSSEVSNCDDRWRVVKRTLRGGVSNGVEVVELDNGCLRIDVIPTRGMGIWRAVLGDRQLGWHSPVRRPVHPNFVPLSEPSGIGFLNGASELMFRCGLESNGVPEFDDDGRLVHGLHGRIANLPAHRVELEFDDDTRLLSLRGQVDETRFLFQKLRLTTSLSTRLGAQEFTWHDRVENIGGTPATMQMLYHVNIGQPLLDPGAQLLAPVRRLAPRDQIGVDAGVAHWQTYPAPDANSVEQVYFLQLVGDDNSNTRVVLHNSAATAGVSLRYSLSVLPYFTQWRNTQSPADGYVTGIEPATNFPNPKSFEAEQGRVIALAPGESWQADVALEWMNSPEQVSQVAAEIAELQADVVAELCPELLPEWSMPSAAGGHPAAEGKQTPW